jgi:hypothetical protein
MPKSFEDRVAEEVNKRLTLAASAAGVDRGRIEIEVLFLLPPEFIRRYRELFDRALADPIRPTGDGGKDEGRVKASGRSSGDPLKARTMGAAQAGKRFVAGSWPIRDERALELKKKLDRQLITLAGDTLALMSMGAAGVEKANPPRQCDICGLFQKPEWVRCPFHI